MNEPDSPQFYLSGFDQQIDAFIEQHRDMLLHSLSGLSEAEARLSLVNSKTTLLGLVKHATFVEKVWFAEAKLGISRENLGIPAGPSASFDLVEGDTISSVSLGFKQAIVSSRAAARGISGDTIWQGNRRGELSLRWIKLHVLREHAQHCGHADILREQVLALRSRA